MTLLRSLLAAALLCGAAVPARASIESYDLAGIVRRADGAIDGTITQRRVVRIDHPRDGAELYFTLLTIEGRSLFDDRVVTVEVAFAGGFVDARHGTYNSEAPAADDVRIGNRVVAFWAYTPNMGGGFAANSLCAWHGGLYRTFEARRGAIVQGRGAGYAVAENVELAALRAHVATLARELHPTPQERRR
jgi:hypothetical protein